ncbi:MAG: 1-deoxy-D-xylulose-5-phosphate synthase [Pseudomonadota bacterium]
MDRIALPADLRRQPRADLPAIANALRDDLVSIVSRTGGHFGASLGVVELTTALHWVFDTPHDKIIWDVSHQCYPHKILTGRREAMLKVRKKDGISGFTCRSESAFDPFGAAHSSTSISAGLGFAAARDLAQEERNVIAVIGDGAMSGGMAFEAMNNAGAQGRPLIIILNDNDMSIAPPSGALRTHLGDLRARRPDAATRHAALAAQPLPSFADGATMFDHFGLRYAGPFDGHDVEEMVQVLEQAKAAREPVLLHVMTNKGHGYAPAEAADDKWHAVATFDPATGVQKKGAGGGPPSYTGVFANALIAQAAADPKVVAVTAAMPSGTGLDKFGAAYPDRCFDAGIAEQHAVTFAAGLACEGFKPFAAIYSTFLQRAYDQVVHDVAIQKLPVRFAIDRAGLVGADGVTHQGSYDIAYLGCLPHFVLMAPSDESELVHMVATACAIDDRPSAVRYPRGAGTGVALPEHGVPLEIGRGRIVREGRRAAVLSYGVCLAEALAAADALRARGIDITVADGRFAKPVDDVLIAQLAREHAFLVVVEEGSIGGFATQVMASIHRQNLDFASGRLVSLRLPDRFIHQASQSEQTVEAALDREAIINAITTRLAASSGGVRRSMSAAAAPSQGQGAAAGATGATAAPASGPRHNGHGGETVLPAE